MPGIVVGTGDSVRNNADVVVAFQELEPREKKDKNHVDKFIIKDYQGGKILGAMKCSSKSGDITNDFLKEMAMSQNLKGDQEVTCQAA